MSANHYTFVVIGGGIAGVSCVEILALLDRESKILLIANSNRLKTSTSAVHLTKTLLKLNVEDKPADEVLGKYRNVETLVDTVTKLNHSSRIIETASNRKISFTKLCICTGARPKLIPQKHPNIIGIRDMQSAEAFEARIRSAKRIMIVGNGAVAADIVNQVKNLEVVWVIKDNYICKKYLDYGAALFLRDAKAFVPAAGGLPNTTSFYCTHRIPSRTIYTDPMPSTSNYTDPIPSTSKYTDPIPSTSNCMDPIPSTSNYKDPMPSTSKYTDPMPSTSNYTNPMPSTSNYRDPIPSTSNYRDPIPSTSNYMDPIPSTSNCTTTNFTSTINIKIENQRERRRKYNSPSGASLGPDWYSKYKLKGTARNTVVVLESGTEIKHVSDGSDDWPIKVCLKNDKCYYVDYVISATGVIPNSEVFKIGNKGLKIAKDGGIVVNNKLETSLMDVFAAGDVCSANWELTENWFQMRLWSQARHMGTFSAKSMVASLKGEEVEPDFRFKIFSHITNLFGYKVVMLGLYNAQKLRHTYEVLIKRSSGRDFIKLVLKDGRVRGALLVGDTGMEELFEGYIMNWVDVSLYGHDILFPQFDANNYPFTSSELQTAYIRRLGPRPNRGIRYSRVYSDVLTN